MRLWRRRPRAVMPAAPAVPAVRLWRGRDPRSAILTVDVDGLCLVSAPWMRPAPCVRCGRAAAGRWHEYGTPELHPVHAECLRALKRELVGS